TLILSGATGAAVIAMIDRLLQRWLDARAAKMAAKAGKEIIDNAAIMVELRALKNTVEKQGRAQRVLMYDRIRHLVQQLVEAGEPIPLGVRTDIDVMYRSYRGDLEANGDLAALMELFYDLPIAPGKSHK
ncbi:MAG TPA: hypothetical protein PKB13_11535, partial [Clostridia bacterium]|nr:hypothetical protein [Clostridia bacterium]